MKGSSSLTDYGTEPEQEYDQVGTPVQYGQLCTAEPPTDMYYVHAQCNDHYSAGRV